MSEQNRVSPDSIRNLAAQTAESRRGRIAFLRVASRVFLGDAGLCVARPLPTPPAVPGDAGSLIHTSRPCLALRLYLRGGRGVLPGASPCPAGHPGAMTQAESPQALGRPSPADRRRSSSGQPWAPALHLAALSASTRPGSVCVPAVAEDTVPFAHSPVSPQVSGGRPLCSLPPSPSPPQCPCD